MGAMLLGWYRSWSSHDKTCRLVLGGVGVEQLSQTKLSRVAAIDKATKTCDLFSEVAVVRPGFVSVEV